MVTDFRCIYYGHVKAGSERSLEHIWPDGLGGDHAPDFFKTREVCGNCNSLSGQFVDGEFQRSFFAGAEANRAALAFLDTSDISKAAALPLIYMGHYPAAPNTAEVCESWLGPRGERIFFFHARDREDLAGFAGGDPIRRSTKDGGRVYLAFARPNLFWVCTAILSVRKTFKHAEFRLLTRTDVPELQAKCAPETEQSRADRAYIAPHLAQPEAHTQLLVDVDYGVRFQCKLALGFGHTLFGPDFAELEYEETLRRGLWERDREKQRGLPIIGTPVLARLRGDDEAILAYPGTYTFLFMRVSAGTMLAVYAPSTRSMRMAIAPGARQLRSPLFDRFGDGFVVVLVPGLQKHFGPYPLETYLAHRHGAARIGELGALEASRRSMEDLDRAVSRFDALPGEWG